MITLSIKERDLRIWVENRTVVNLAKCTCISFTLELGILSHAIYSALGHLYISIGQEQDPLSLLHGAGEDTHVLPSSSVQRKPRKQSQSHSFLFSNAFIRCILPHIYLLGVRIKSLLSMKARAKGNKHTYYIM